MWKIKWLLLLLIIPILYLLYNLIFVDHLDKKKISLSAIEDEILKPYHLESDEVVAEENNESTPTGKDLLIQTLFSSVSANDIEVFIQLFSTEVISKDLFSNENPDKMEVALGLINDISQDGKLLEISYEEKRGFIKDNSDEMRVNLYYENDVKATLTLSLEKHSSHHKEDNFVYYLIATPPSEIIKTVKASS